MQILTSDRFKKDYEQIKKFIRESSDEKSKMQVNSLLNELVGHVKKMDSYHLDLASIGKLADDTNQVRDKIRDVRKKIFKIIESN